MTVVLKDDISAARYSERLVKKSVKPLHKPASDASGNIPNALAKSRSLLSDRPTSFDQYANSRTKLLDKLSVRSIAHFGRPLREHLIGTHDLLDRWGNEEHVCLAGLFHSVYGTNTFRAAAELAATREDLRAAIGADAEALVYIFGMSERKRLLLENASAPYCWVDYRTGKLTVIPVDVLDGLVEIEVANFLEQMPFLADVPESVFQDMRHRFESATARMSVHARNAFPRAFHGRNSSPIMCPKQNA